MDKEYRLMTLAPRKVIVKLLNEKGYEELEVDSWEFPLFRNSSRIGLNLEKVDEDNFDMYQANQRGKKNFIENPNYFLYSDIEKLWFQNLNLKWKKLDNFIFMGE